MDAPPAAGHDSETADGHVHFSEDQLSEHDADIVIRPARKAHTLEVHLGFLQFKHTYQVKFTIEDDLGEVIESDPLQNLNVKVIEAVPKEDGSGHHVTVEFAANKERLQRESLELISSTDRKNKLTLAFHARVLGKGKGTPSLKTGIHVIRVETEDDSELSDWPGFG